ncbi:hypothetical protein B1VFA_071 [Rhizobium phage B1VFA]|nr:hypothetical protein B1VFA_071 [Rhizobium phage B1VFA]
MQVYCGTRRVGVANIAPRPDQRDVRIAIAPPVSFAAPGSLPTFEAVRELRLPIEWAYFRIDNLHLAQYGADYEEEVFKKHGVSKQECEAINRFEQDAKDYRYRVLKVDKDQLEEIFDFDWFEPADGPPDADYFERRREMRAKGYTGV